MKREWEVIRDILLRIENSVTPNTVVSMNDFDGVDPQVVAYNIRYLKEYGCIVASVNESTTGDNLINNAIARRLTPTGHELLDSIRNETVWSQVKDKFKKKGLEMTIDLVISSAKHIIQNMI